MTMATEKKEKEGEMRVKKIENGAVIDHVNAGKAPAVLKLLGIDSTFPGTVSILMNIPSAKFGLKDIIKIEGKVMAGNEINRIALVSPHATVNIVKDYSVVKKHAVKLPEKLEGVIACPNAICISNREGVPRLRVEQQSPLKVRCEYCERVFTEEQLA